MTESMKSAPLTRPFGSILNVPQENVAPLEPIGVIFPFR